MEKIIILLTDDGKVEVKTEGFKGKACLKASEFLEQALGKISSTKKTSSYYEEEKPETVRIKSNG